MPEIDEFHFLGTSHKACRDGYGWSQAARETSRVTSHTSIFSDSASENSLEMGIPNGEGDRVPEIKFLTTTTTTKANHFPLEPDTVLSSFSMVWSG